MLTSTLPYSRILPSRDRKGAGHEFVNANLSAGQAPGLRRALSPPFWRTLTHGGQ
jgi:hypothetical protein